MCKIQFIVFALVAIMIHKGYSDQVNLCSDKEVECADGKKCVYKAWLCDGDPDCEDSSDEKYCHPKRFSSTSPAPTTNNHRPTNSTEGYVNITKTTNQVPTVDPACEKLVLSSCSSVGYRLTRLPNFFRHSNQNQVRRALRQWRPILDTGCSSLLEEFVCRIYAPPCKVSKIPCRSMCRRIKKQCQKTMKRRKLKWPSSLRCGSLPRKRCLDDVVSISSTTKKPTINRVKQTTIKRRPVQRRGCEKLTIPLCQHLQYNLTSYPNFLSHLTQDEAALEVHQFQPLIQIQCSPYLRLFLCTVYAPACTRDFGNILPCRSLCERAKIGCEGIMKQYGFSWPERLNCSRFPTMDNYQVCIPGDTSKNGMTTSRPSYTENMRTNTVQTPPLPTSVHASTPTTPHTIPPTIQSESNLSGVSVILTNTQGVLTSPNYPNAYPPKTRRKWTIKLPSFYNVIKITIDTMRLEEDRNCFYDYVMIVDKMRNQVGPRHCGTYRQPYIIPVRGNEVSVVFVSDDNTNKKGFSLSYIGLIIGTPAPKGSGP